MAAKTRITPEVVAQARRLISEGASQRQAASELGISQSGLSVKLADADFLTHDPTEDYEEIPVVVRDYSHLGELKVYPLGDLHIGTPAHDRERWEEWVDYLIRSKDSSLLGTGDFLNAALKDSKSEAYDEHLTVGDAKRRLRAQLKPLAEDGRIDLLVPGNHEDRIYRAVGDCPIHDLSDALGVPFSRSAALLIYRVGDVEYTVYMRHGTGNGQSLAQLSKSAMTVDADVYVTGHTHKQAATADEYFTLDEKAMKVRRAKRYYVSSGSFLRYETYAAQRGYTPTRLGSPRVHLSGARKDVHVSI